MWNVKCRVWSVKCGVRSEESKVFFVRTTVYALRHGPLNLNLTRGLAGCRTTKNHKGPSRAFVRIKEWRRRRLRTAKLSSY